MEKATARALGDISDERDRQRAKWGEQRHPDINHDAQGTLIAAAGRKLTAAIYKGVADDARRVCERNAKSGSLTWHDILCEEVCEALFEAACGNKVKLRKELVQVAAVATAWIEDLDQQFAAKRSSAMDSDPKPEREHDANLGRTQRRYNATEDKTARGVVLDCEGLSFEETKALLDALAKDDAEARRIAGSVVTGIEQFVNGFGDTKENVGLLLRGVDYHMLKDALAEGRVEVRIKGA